MIKFGKVSNLSISIKDVDEKTFLNFKAEAIREGLKLGEAASEAFQLWINSKKLRRLKDFERIKIASEEIDQLREKSEKNFNSLEVLKKWREIRR